MPTIAQVVADAMKEAGQDYVWFGDLDIWGGTYEKATGKRLHPMNEWQAVRKALSRSKLFKTNGRIRAIGWSGREILHPRFVLVANEQHSNEPRLIAGTDNYRASSG